MHAALHNIDMFGERMTKKMLGEGGLQLRHKHRDCDKVMSC